MGSRIFTKKTFSTSNFIGQIVQLPTQVYGVEGKYAAALYSSAYKKKNLDTVAKDVEELKKLYSTNNEFKLFVENPTLNRKKKRDAIKAVLKTFGVSQETQNFVGVLAENGRLTMLKNVFNAFETLMRAHKGELFVEITTAEPLSKKHEQLLMEALKKFVSADQKLHVTYATKPNLLGGIIINIGDKYVDLSFASRLKKFNSILETSI